MIWILVVVSGVILLIAANYEHSEPVQGEKKTTVHPGVLLVLGVVFVLLLLGALGALGSSSEQPKETGNTPPVQVKDSGK